MTTRPDAMAVAVGRQSAAYETIVVSMGVGEWQPFIDYLSSLVDDEKHVLVSVFSYLTTSISCPSTLKNSH